MHLTATFNSYYYRHTYNRHTSMTMAGFEPAIPANERPQNYALDRSGTEIGISLTFEDYMNIKIIENYNKPV